MPRCLDKSLRAHLRDIDAWFGDHATTSNTSTDDTTQSTCDNHRPTVDETSIDALVDETSIDALVDETSIDALADELSAMTHLDQSNNDHMHETSDADDSGIGASPQSSVNGSVSQLSGLH